MDLWRTTLDNLAELLIRHIDLTNLDEATTEQEIDNLCQRAITPLGNVAAVCVFANHVKQCKTALINTSIKIATVANFPQGTAPLLETCHLIETALHDGADEIDLVLPYAVFLAGNTKAATHYLTTCEKLIHPHACFKVILETGALPTQTAIADASKLALDCGADFLKTSTGKIAVGATLEAAETMLKTIKATGSTAGFKASGGIKTAQQSLEYYSLTTQYLLQQEKPPLSQTLFRLGTSRLLEVLLDLNLDSNSPLPMQQQPAERDY